MPGSSTLRTSRTPTGRADGVGHHTLRNRESAVVAGAASRPRRILMNASVSTSARCIPTSARRGSGLTGRRFTMGVGARVRRVTSRLVQERSPHRSSCRPSSDRIGHFLRVRQRAGVDRSELPMAAEARTSKQPVLVAPVVAAVVPPHHHNGRSLTVVPAVLRRLPRLLV